MTWARSSKLQCEFHGWRVMSKCELALDLRHGECCDMAGAIEIAQHIMPEVTRIVTFEGGIHDTEYQLRNGEWLSYADPTRRE